MIDWIVWWSLLVVTADEEINKGKEYRWKKRWDSGSRSLVSPNISSTTKGKLNVLVPALPTTLKRLGVFWYSTQLIIYISTSYTLCFFIYDCVTQPNWWITHLRLSRSGFFIYDVMNTWNSGLKWVQSQKKWFKTFGLQFIVNQTGSQTLVWLLLHER